MRILLCLLLSSTLSACSTLIGVPDSRYLQDCQGPTFPAAGSVVTNGELWSYTQGLKNALRGCNDDKAALREFYS